MDLRPAHLFRSRREGGGGALGMSMHDWKYFIHSQLGQEVQMGESSSNEKTVVEPLPMPAKGLPILLFPYNHI